MSRRAFKAIAIAVGVLLAAFGSVRYFQSVNSPPETPGNAVIDFGSKVVLRNYNGAWNRVCSALKLDAFALHDDAQGGERFGALEALLLHMGNISSDYETEIDGDTAREPVTVRPWDVPDDRSNEKWIITLVKEDGKWRVCGSERAS